MEGIKQLAAGAFAGSARKTQVQVQAVPTDDQNVVFISRALPGQFGKIYLFLEIESIFDEHWLKKLKPKLLSFSGN